MKRDKEKKFPWIKVLWAADLMVVFVAFVFMGLAFWTENPANTLPFNPSAVAQVITGFHFLLQGVLYWKEHRVLAIVNFVMVALVLLMIFLLTIMR